MLHMKFLYIWIVGSREEEFYMYFPISLGKKKRPLVGPFLEGFYFYAQTLQTMSQGCCMSKIRVLGSPVHEKKIFLKFTFLPFIGPQWVPAPWFSQLESPFPKDASYQIWLKSVQWFWRRSRLNEKFTDRRDVITIAHLSLRLRWAKNGQQE